MAPADRAQLVGLMQQMHANLEALMPGASDGSSTPPRMRARVRTAAKPRAAAPKSPARASLAAAKP
jgi:hypothetical protein